MKQTLSLLIVATLVLSGCATMNKNECLTADWYQIGYEDGARGYPDMRIGDHRESCAKYGVTPDFRAYQDGHEEGVIRFCTPENGFEQGKRGYQYSGICPPSLEGAFLDSYEAGREIFAARSLIRQLENEQRQNEAEIELLQERIVELTAIMLSPDTSFTDAVRLSNEIAEMNQQLGALEERNKQVIIELAEAQARLKILQEKYAYY